MRYYLVLPAFILLFLACQRERTVSFNDDIRPILNEKCIGCHGGVKQAGGVGFVFRENALRVADSGATPIVPGKPGRSELIARIRHHEEELRMPYEADPLSEAEITLLETWIDEGASWEEHWAYQPPKLPDNVSLAGLDVSESVDSLVKTSLRSNNLAPARLAKKHTLLRRLSFDLTGLPAPANLTEDFLNNRLPYPALVDSLLARPAYGEHMAAKWLELARYADSRGYERDRKRDIWQYRDWVIDAYNSDMPYDRFIIDQLAGDLHPQPTQDQMIATGFHRNTMSNGEGGTDNEEFRVAAVMDRVATTWEVFQGTTMACVQCHSHPYDPITHEEYYTTYALFNNTIDHDHVSEAPLLRTFHRADQIKYDKVIRYLQQNNFARTQVQGSEEKSKAVVTPRAFGRMLTTREPRLRPYDFDTIRGGVFTGRADEDVLFLKPGDNFTLPPLDLTEVAALHVSHHVMGRGTLSVRLDDEAGPVVASYEFADKGWNYDARLPLPPTDGERRLYLEVAGGGSDGNILAVNAIGMEPKLPGDDPEQLERMTAFVADLMAAEDSVTTPVMVEMEGNTRRKSHVFTRGNWLVHGEEVTAGVPDLLHADSSEINSRLDFARWLTNPQQPLTARVEVNRIWDGLFGRGLVPTVEDLGSQGDKPRYQDLLDFLAVRFSEDLNWSRKALVRAIVLTEVYRQSSDATPELLERDPFNDLLARGPRKRLTAEEIRDQNLAISGLLSQKMHGPGVMPVQPDGLWDNIPYSEDEWKTSDGEDRYRRTIYTYLRRSVVHPGLTTFDASNREVCLSRRTVTNTPLQALLALNAPENLDVAKALSEQVSDQPILERQVDQLFRRLLLRPANEEEVRVLVGLYEEASRDRGENEHALVVIINALLNIDEYLTLS